MAVRIEVSLPWGRYHATPWDRGVNEGVVEWPPSPWRVLRALVACAYERHPGIDPAVVESMVMTLAAQAPEYLVPPYGEGHTRSYKPIDSGSTLVFDPFITVAPGARFIVEWPDAELTDGQRAALKDLCDSLPYLGRAESVVEARLLDPEDPRPDDMISVVPDRTASEQERIELLAPAEGARFTDLLVTAGEVRQKLRRPVPPNTRWLSYRRPVRHRHQRPANTTRPPIHLIVWSATANQPLLGSRGLYLAESLRKAVMSVAADSGKVVPGIISGRVDPAVPTLRSGHGHAHFLVLPRIAGTSAGAERVAGVADIERVALWVPDGIESELATRLVGRLQRVSALSWHRDVPTFRVSPAAVAGGNELEAALPDFAASAHRFVSVTPFLSGRHLRPGRDERQMLQSALAKAAAERGLATPTLVEWSPVDRRVITRRLGGPPKMAAPGRPARNDRRQFHGYHVTIEFPDSVSGPLLLGGLAHFGMGLFRPLTDR